MFGAYAILKASRNDPEYSQSFTNHVKTLYNPKNILCVIYHAQWIQNRLCKPQITSRHKSILRQPKCGYFVEKSMFVSLCNVTGP